MPNLGTIKNFSGYYGFLSNFAQTPIRWQGHEWPTAEHAFQAAKATTLPDMLSIKAAASPGIAKRLGRKVERRKDWEDVKLSIMDEVLQCKFLADPSRRLSLRLVNTMGYELVEGNTWGDTFWGVCGSIGHNHLGVLLMRRRHFLYNTGFFNGPQHLPTTP